MEDRHLTMVEVKLTDSTPSPFLCYFQKKYALPAVQVPYLPDPKQFNIFGAADLLYIGLRMIGDLLGKNTGTAPKAQSGKRFQEMVGP